jgi:hypothetical protein
LYEDFPTSSWRCSTATNWWPSCTRADPVDGRMTICRRGG